MPSTAQGRFHAPFLPPAPAREGPLRATSDDRRSVILQANRRSVLQPADRITPYKIGLFGRFRGHPFQQQIVRFLRSALFKQFIVRIEQPHGPEKAAARPGSVVEHRKGAGKVQSGASKKRRACCREECREKRRVGKVQGGTSEGASEGIGRPDQTAGSDGGIERLDRAAGSDGEIGRRDRTAGSDGGIGRRDRTAS